MRLEAAERFQAIENVSKNGSFGHKILRHNANIYHIRESPRHQTPYQLPMTKSNMPGGMPCNGAAFGAEREKVDLLQRNLDDLRRMLPPPDAKPRRWWPW